VRRDYQSTAIVTINPITTSPFDSTPIGQQVNTTTERSVVLSRRVASLAADDDEGSHVSSTPVDARQFPSFRGYRCDVDAGRRSTRCRRTA